MDFGNVMRPPSPADQLGSGSPNMTIGFDTVIPAQPPQQELGEPNLAERTIGFDNVISPYHKPDAQAPRGTARFRNVLETLGPPEPEGIPTPLEWFQIAQSGQGLEGYELTEPAGRGPLGLTFKGRRAADQKPVVVKLINERFMAHPDLLRGMIDDVGKWRGHPHRSLTSVLGTGISNRRQIVIFEAAAGAPLRRVLAERGPLPPGQALRVVFELAQVLAAAQAAGVCHGDIRAEKVYFDGEHAVLADPGFARAACLVAGFGQFGLAFGHPNYLAPEVLQEGMRQPNAQTDIYALGILFYEMLCGRLPFQGEPRQVMSEHLSSPLPPPPPGVSFNTTLAALILRMTSKDPLQRLPGATDLLDVLTLILQGEPIVFDGPVPRRADPDSDVGAVIAEPEAQEKVPDQVWEKQSVSAAKGSRRWDKAKIQNAERVGPEEWSPNTMNEDEFAADKALAAVIAAASKGRTAPARTGKGGAALGPSQGPKKGFPVIPAAVGAMLILVGLGLAFYPWDRDDPERKTSTTPPRVTAPVYKPSDKLAEQIQAKEELRKRVKKELATYTERADELLRRESFQKVVDLGAALSEDALASAEGQAALAAVRGEVQSRLDAKFNAAKLEIDGHVAREDYAAAQQVAAEMRAWVLDKDRLAQLEKDIEAKRDAKLLEVSALRLKRPLKNLNAARRKLGKAVNGKVVLFKRGGLMVTYPQRSGAALYKDLALWKGNKKNVLLGKGGQVDKALRIYANKTPAMLNLRVPLMQLLDVKIGLMVKKDVRDGARFAVFIGARENNLESKGVSWGHTPVELDRAGRVVDILSQEMPKIPTSTPLELTVRVDGKGNQKTLKSHLVSKPRGVESADPLRLQLQRPMRLGRSWSTITIYVANVDVYITSLEVRGVVDPSAVN